jgi:transcription antitermination factor NusG
MEEQPRWYVFKLRPGFESIVSEKLRRRGIEVFVPEYRPHKAKAKQPVFPNFLFGRSTSDIQQLVTSIPGVLCIMGTPEPVPFDDGELADLRRAINSGLPFRVLPLTDSLETVRVVDGPLRGLKGSVVTLNSTRCFGLHLKAIHKTIVFELQSSYRVRKISRRRSGQKPSPRTRARVRSLESSSRR